MRVPASLGTNKLPTVDDHSHSAASGTEDPDNNDSANAATDTVTTGGGGGGGTSRMKRSPYLSVMAGSTKESEDLVALLSRPKPTGGDTHEQSDVVGTTPSLGADVFFNLKRPSHQQQQHPSLELNRPTTTQESSNTVTPVSSEGNEIGTYCSDEDKGSSNEGEGGSGGSHSGNIGGGGVTSAHARVTKPIPSLRSALRVGATSTSSSHADIVDLKKNASVTFTDTTKTGSAAGVAASSSSSGSGLNATFTFGQQQQQQGSQQSQAQPQLGGSRGNTTTPSSGQQQQQFFNYSAESMMKKSQSIAAPQFMLTHMNSSLSTSANESFAMNSGVASVASSDGSSSQVGGVSFPIFLGKLKSSKTSIQSSTAPPGGTPTTTTAMPRHVRKRSQSSTTLKYYASHNMNSINSQNLQKDPAQLLQAAGIQGFTPICARTSINGLNLTFRDMLDEGDGTEGDLNNRLRNQQWKDFSKFSNTFDSANPMLLGRVDENHNESGCDESCGSVDGGMGSAKEQGMEGNDSKMSGSKRSLTPTSGSGSSMTNNNSNNNIEQQQRQQQWPPSGLGGAHRATVSVNDLAMLRRAASRMKMSNITGTSGVGRNISNTATDMTSVATNNNNSQPSPIKLPGQTLGGDMLSRLSQHSSMSVERSSHSGSNNSGGDISGQQQGAGITTSTNTASAIAPTKTLSPLEQMMAKTNNQQFRVTTNNPFLRPSMGAASSSTNNITMGPRRVHTVGAGLAYGRVNMTTGPNRLSRFNLSGHGNNSIIRNTNSRLSEISSGGSSNTPVATGRGNEGWDL